MKSLMMGLVATLAVSMAFAAPAPDQIPGQPGAQPPQPGQHTNPMPVRPRPGRPGRPNPGQPPPPDWQQPPGRPPGSPPPPDRNPGLPQRPMPPPHRPGPGRQSDIVRLGGTRLSPITDADTIDVNTCAAGEDGRIDAIRITAVQHSSQIQGVRVQYGDLSSDDIPVQTSLSPGQSSQWILLDGGRRGGDCVRSIRVFGRSLSIGLKKATIDIYGRRDYF